ncbi:hypothetical protein R9X49_13065 [Pectobacterium carotovorum]|uniref:hypothetical protein n=1 Tax=Pectobacterium carotovorum TaxID=554 RepID=UPI0029DDBF66|nr:hypothetical protein [Pectobacterium carotovorum]MDX6916038.1 hypothetical protein [Pectobacterium carotovorum]
MKKAMMLLDMPIVNSTLGDLRKQFQEFDATVSYQIYLTCCDAVEEWKFSDGDYFGHLPYSDERMGFSSPRLMKRKYANVDEARWLGKYCAGFSGGRHVITISPGQKSVQAIQGTLYNRTGDVLEIATLGFKGIDRPESAESTLLGLGRMLQLDDNARIYIGVGMREAFAVFLYQYSSSGRVLSGRAFSKGWPDEDEWFCHYDNDGKLIEIMSGDVPVWRKK